MAIIKRSTTTIIGLDTQLATVNENITAETLARQAADGTLTLLATTAKGNLVAAINEVKASVDTEASTRSTAIGSFDTFDVYGYASSTASAGFNPLETMTINSGSVRSVIETLNYGLHYESIERIALANNLQQQITNILSNTDATALNSLSELVTAFQNADSNLNLAITTLADTASTNLSNEVTARTNADTEIKNALKAYADHVDTTSELMVSTVYTRLSTTLDKVSQNIKTSFSVQKVSVANGTALEVILDDAQTRLKSTSSTAAKLRNFGSIRTIVDGQAYDLTGSIVAVNVGGEGYPKVVISDLSASDLTFFTGKTFTVEFEVPEAELHTSDVNSYRATLAAFATATGSLAEPNAIKTLNTASTPWGALV